MLIRIKKKLFWGVYFQSTIVSCRAKDAGITVVNEVGLDPGIDHFLALQCFDEIREHGGKVGGGFKSLKPEHNSWHFQMYYLELKLLYL